MVEQACGFRKIDSSIRANKPGCSGGDSFGPLRGIAHQQHRLAEARCLFLNPALIGQDYVAGRHHHDEIKIVERIDRRDVVMPRQGRAHLTFHDLRGTAVTRLAKAGCTVPEIATITGHSLKDVGTILDSHYLSRDHALGESAIRKLEKGTKTPN